MPNVIIQLMGVASAIFGLVVLNFLLIIYVSVRRFGGKLQRRHVIVISSVALAFFVVAVILTIIGGI